MNNQNLLTATSGALIKYTDDIEQIFSRLTLETNASEEWRNLPLENLFLIIDQSVEVFSLKMIALKGRKRAGRVPLGFLGLSDTTNLKLVSRVFRAEVNRIITGRFDGQLTLPVILEPRLSTYMARVTPNDLLANVRIVNLCFGVGPTCNSELSALQNIPGHFPALQTVNIRRISAFYDRTLQGISEEVRAEYGDLVYTVVNILRRQGPYTAALAANLCVNITFVMLHRDGKLIYDCVVGRRDLHGRCLGRVEMDA